jgi:hypothetical protein
VDNRRRYEVYIKFIRESNRADVVSEQPLTELEAHTKAVELNMDMQDVNKEAGYRRIGSA